MNKYLKKLFFFLPEISVFALAIFTRFFRLDIPKTHIFDEVYHAFTAQEMFKGNPAAWEWWNTSPKGFAYEWTHPPVAKEFMVVAIRIFGDNSFAWRFFSAFFGFLVIVLIYLLAYKLFKNRVVAILASFIAALDGLLLTMSRIAMNDIYLLFFILLAFLLFLHKRYFLMSIALGLSVASKWTGFFAIGLVAVIYLLQDLGIYRKNLKKIPIKSFRLVIYFVVIPALIYLSTYAPFFGGKHYAPALEKSTLVTFVNLQQQMYWYHTNLKAHHTYESKPVQWLFDLRPVWFYVDYKDKTIANIYNLGNPIVMWVGFSSIVFLLLETFKKRKFESIFLLSAYFIFFIPWLFSPRIMFYYHYLPSMPFLSISLAYLLNQIIERNKNGVVFVGVLLGVAGLIFLYFFPLWTAIQIPKELYDTYFWFKSWK